MKVLQAVQRMKTHVVKISSEQTLSEAIDKMDIYQVDGLPVVNSEGRLVGILTEADIIRALWNPQDAAQEATIAVDEQPQPHEKSLEENSLENLLAILKRNLANGQNSVKDYMTTAVVTAMETEELASAATVMLLQGFKRLPVLNDQHQVIGTLNRVDVLQALMEGEL